MTILVQRLEDHTYFSPFLNNRKNDHQRLVLLNHGYYFETVVESKTNFKKNKRPVPK